ncbi:SAM-dependent methyltransferase [soil metagenome]
MTSTSEQSGTPGAGDHVAAAVADQERFVSASFTGARRHTTPAAEKVTLRPVDLRAGRQLQISRFDGRSTDVTNVALDEAAATVSALLEEGFATAYVKTLDGDLQLQHSRKGVPRIVRHRPTASAVDTSHDRSKPRLIEPGAPFLRAVGITTERGEVKPTAAGKYRQVERFVEILTHTWPDEAGGHGAVRAVDLGCGAGVLTLATHHHLSRVAPGSTMTGVDTKAELMAALNTAVDDLGWSGVEFRTGQITDFESPETPDLVLALHACDTATDDALARAGTWGARVVLAAPCGQHDLQSQLDRQNVPDGFDPMMRHGIVRERLGDLLTDTLRAEILRAHGYRTDVIEFVSTEHTAKNLMIRAVRTHAADPEITRAAGDAAEWLAGLWGVEHALARRIGYRAG